MAFLDNSGDIILDAVLTDTGRMRLAKGDGSFRIVKFAFGDDEIDYTTYNKTHPSGSAYYDIEILQSPVLEAFTNNTSLLKSRLLSIPRNNLLYLPVLKVNEVFDSATKMSSSATAAATFSIPVDENTENDIFKIPGLTSDGIIKGELGQAGAYIRVDQGLDTTDIPPGRTLDADLVETQYIVEIDNRFGRLVDVTSGSPASVSFIDDDNVASYFLSLGTDTEFVQDNTATDTGTGSGQTIAGPRGTFLKFRIQASLELNTSTFLFTQLGSTVGYYTVANPSGPPATSMYTIDTIVRVTGATTGQRVDIPVRFVKRQ